MPSLFCISFLIYFFLQISCGPQMCVIYVREDNDSNAYAMITQLVWTTWTPMSAVPNKAVKLNHSLTPIMLTHWGRVTHICINKLATIGADNGLLPGQCQAIIWTYAGILLIGPLWTNFIAIVMGIQIFSFKKMHLKMSSAKWRPFCLSLNVLM